MDVVYLYSVWHYSRGIKDFIRVWTNFIWFFWNFFSISLLAKTLFSPFRRMNEDYKKGFDPVQFFQTLLINFILRMVGAVARTIIILIGIGVLCATLILGSVLFVAWVIGPITIGILFFGGFLLIVS